MKMGYFETEFEDIEFEYCQDQKKVQNLTIEKGSLLVFNKKSKELIWIIPRRDLINLARKKVKGMD
jgi:hypothetical protein